MSVSAKLSSVQRSVSRALATQVAPEESICVGFSGGMDSAALLHALASLPETQGRLRAVHVNHGLHPDADAWAAHCAAFCAELGVEFGTVEVAIDPAEPGGPEGRARSARYRALRELLADDEILVTAHHQQDQAETFLLQLMRGAGPAGLRGMALRHAANGLTILRPLLEVAPAAIRVYAASARLSWIDDPSNVELRFDRNYLRHEILPLLIGRWPAALEVITRSARLCGIAVDAADEVAAASLADMLVDNRLDLELLARLESPHQSQLLRAAIQAVGLPLPSEQQLNLALAGLLESRQDAELQFTWPGGAVRRYRNTAWLYAAADNELINQSRADEFNWQPPGTLDLGALAGRLTALAAEPGPGVLAMPASGWLVRFRRGGERLRLHAQGPERSLKNLLQENDVVPWMRSHIPIVCSAGTVVAVGDLWTNADCLVAPGAPGIRLEWQPNSRIR